MAGAYAGEVHLSSLSDTVVNDNLQPQFGPHKLHEVIGFQFGSFLTHSQED